VRLSQFQARKQKWPQKQGQVTLQPHSGQSKRHGLPRSHVCSSPFATITHHRGTPAQCRFRQTHRSNPQTRLKATRTLAPLNFGEHPYQNTPSSHNLNLPSSPYSVAMVGLLSTVINAGSSSSSPPSVNPLYDWLIGSTLLSRAE
jgi:hypothetical protein